MSDPLYEIYDAISELKQGHADLEARIERMFRKGKVTDVDPQNHLYRQEIGLDDGGQTVKSPWLPYSQIAGNRKTHSMPSVGEQYLLVNPDGHYDFTTAVGFPHGWYDQNPSPSTDPDVDVTTRGTTTDTTTKDSRVINVGNASVTIKDGEIDHTVGSVTLKVSANGVDVTNGYVKHNGLDIGATHVHGGVQSGSSHTGVPDP